MWKEYSTAVRRSAEKQTVSCLALLRAGLGGIGVVADEMAADRLA
jgi:hypothetical protein